MSVYLDANASAPLRPGVARVMAESLEAQANAQSAHAPGQAARTRVDAARRAVRELVGGDGDVVFTASGTESIALAMLGSLARRAPGHLVVGALEHSAVLDAAAELERRGWRVSRAGATADGRVTADAVRSVLEPDTALVSLQHANNETGVVQPVAEIGALAAAAGALFHVDAVQSAGKLRLDAPAWPAALVSVAAHKLGGPAGVGALWKRRGLDLAPLVPGSQEQGWRGGTPNLPGIVGFHAALEGLDAAAEARRARALRDLLEHTLAERVPLARVTGARSERLANTTHLTFSAAVGGDLVTALDLAGFAVSAGSACRAGSDEPSQVLLAMGLPEANARTAVRVSTHPETTEQELLAFVDALAALVSARTGAVLESGA